MALADPGLMFHVPQPSDNGSLQHLDARMTVLPLILIALIISHVREFLCPWT